MLKKLMKLFRPAAKVGVFVGRQRTRDISFLAQAPSGFVGRVSRNNPSPTTTAALNDTTNPVASYGSAVLNTTSNTARAVTAADTALLTIDGIAVQPYPFQQQATGNFGAVAPGSAAAVPTGLIDIVRSGFVTVYCNNAVNANQKSPVYVWIAASSGNHIQGGFEMVAASTNTIPVAGKTFFNGPGDSTGAIELAFNL